MPGDSGQDRGVPQPLARAANRQIESLVAAAQRPIGRFKPPHVGDPLPSARQPHLDPLPVDRQRQAIVGPGVEDRLRRLGAGPRGEDPDEPQMAVGFRPQSAAEIQAGGVPLRPMEQIQRGPLGMKFLPGRFDAVGADRLESRAGQMRLESRPQRGVGG